MQLSSFSRPEKVGHLDPAVLDNVQTVFPDHMGSVRWYRSGNPEPDRPQLMAALAPLHRQLLSQYTRSPYAIYYEVDTRSVAPGKTQRGQEWHIDKGDVPQFVVASHIPTEMLIPDPKKRPTVQQLVGRRALAQRHNRLDLFTLSDERIAELGLVPYQPDPYDVVYMKGQIHRSAKNNTKQTLPRTWLRAVVIRTAFQQR